MTGHTDERAFQRYTIASAQRAAIAAFYKAEEGEQPLVFAKSLDRKQRQLLEAMAEMTGKSPLYQEDLDSGAINFAQLWEENLQDLEQVLRDVRALPGRLGVADFGDTVEKAISLEAVVEESNDRPQISMVDMPLNAVHVGLTVEVSGEKKGTVRKEIEDRVLSPHQMVKSKPRGNEYELTVGVEDGEALAAIVVQMEWEMELLGELDDCEVKVAWLDKQEFTGELTQESLEDEPAFTKSSAGQRPTSTTSVYQLKITLLGVRPQVWRRIQVPEAMTMEQLNSVLQVVMGWEGYHLHEFSESEDEAMTLAELIEDDLFSFGYLYDFGDMWRHEIKVEKRLASEPGKNYPVCLAEKRACPPEDCGGDWGYARLLKVLKNPQHLEYEERLEWVGSDFDPKVFELKEVNQGLRELEVR